MIHIWIQTLNFPLVARMKPFSNKLASICDRWWGARASSNHRLNLSIPSAQFFSIFPDDKSAEEYIREWRWFESVHRGWVKTTSADGRWWAPIKRPETDASKITRGLYKASIKTTTDFWWLDWLRERSGCRDIYTNAKSTKNRLGKYYYLLRRAEDHLSVIAPCRHWTPRVPSRDGWFMQIRLPLSG